MTNNVNFKTENTISHTTSLANGRNLLSKVKKENSFNNKSLFSLPKGIKVSDKKLIKDVSSYSRIYNDFAFNNLHIGMLYMAPHYEVRGKQNSCKHAGLCKHFCVGNGYRKKRMELNKLLLNETTKNNFLNQLSSEIFSHSIKSISNSFKPAIRLNGLSDYLFESKDFHFTLEPGLKTKMLAKQKELGNKFNVINSDFEKGNIFQLFSEIQFYDYTKFLPKERKPEKNYHLTYSYDLYLKKHYGKKLYKLLDCGHNIAIIFDKDYFSKKFRGKDSFYLDTDKKYKVMNGDMYDYRPFDENSKENNMGLILALCSVSGLRFAKNLEKSISKKIVIDSDENLNYIVLGKK